MARILLVDDDEVGLGLVSHLLRLSGHQVQTAQNGRDGVMQASIFKPHVALIDLRLPDTSGTEVIRQLHEHQPSIVCAVVTGFGTLDSAVDAIRLGVYDYVEKPIVGDDVVDLVERAYNRYEEACQNTLEAPHIQAHSIERWTGVVVRTISSPTDPRTLEQWGRAVGASAGTLRNWCRTAHLSARRSLLFARVLRAVARHQHSAERPEDLLDVVDQRTLAKILAASGGTADQLPRTIDEFLSRQQLIACPMGIEEVRRTITTLRQRRSAIAQPSRGQHTVRRQ